MLNSSVVTKQHLEQLGYRPHTASTIIRQAKQIMVQRGYPFYNNKRLSHVPINIVEEIIGVSLEGDIING